MAKNPLKLPDTILRDAHQSQAATRMRLEDMLPCVRIIGQYGILVFGMLGRGNF